MILPQTRRETSNMTVEEFKSISKKRSKLLQGAILTVVIVILAIFAMNIITLIRLNSIDDQIRSSTATQNSTRLNLTSSIRVEEVMVHLQAFQKIADIAQGRRDVTSIGFNRTLDYIHDELNMKTNFHVNRTYFLIRNFLLLKDPILIASINGIVIRNYTYSTDATIGEIVPAIYSGSITTNETFQITVIPGDGCDERHWIAANPSAIGRVVLLGDESRCGYVERVALGAQFGVIAILIFNGLDSYTGFFPNEIALNQDNTIPVLFLSSAAGRTLVDAALDNSSSVNIQISIELMDLPRLSVGNICADTRTGDPTKTIIVGSHSDSVPGGPGINDNGSGTAVNLALAMTLARLMQTETYPAYEYRIRFCWWGAEEIDLLGSDFFVKQAQTETRVGERLTDFLAYLNYDMLASPNYMFGIYDGESVKNRSLTSTIAGSKRLTSIFRNWFHQQNLPWTSTNFTGYSDYAAFVREGIACGGLYSGSAEIKSKAERNYYWSVLGTTSGGISGVAYDPCYHRACDTIENINVFALEKMTKAAAHILESLGYQHRLREWLYYSD